MVGRGEQFANSETGLSPRPATTENGPLDLLFLQELLRLRIYWLSKCSQQHLKESQFGSPASGASFAKKRGVRTRNNMINFAKDDKACSGQLLR